MYLANLVTFSFVVVSHPSPLLLPLPVFLIRFAWCFRDPVNTEEVTDYLDVVTDPIDLRTIEKRIRKGDWYKNKHMLYSDMMKMVNNCKLYNGEGSTYYEYAVSLEKYLATLFPKRLMSAAAAVVDSAGGG